MHLPMVRQIFPKLISTDLVKVQPMSPISGGSIFYIDEVCDNRDAISGRIFARIYSEVRDFLNLKLVENLKCVHRTNTDGSYYNISGTLPNNPKPISIWVDIVNDGIILTVSGDISKHMFVDPNMIENIVLKIKSSYLNV